MARVSVEQFTVEFIRSQRREGYLGVHTVWSKYNQCIRAAYALDPIELTKTLAGEGVIEIRPTRGGVMIYIAGEAPTGQGQAEQKKVDLLVEQTTTAALGRVA